VLSCVVNSVDTVRALAGETVLVIGGGPTGALHALLFAAGGASVIVSDPVRSAAGSVAEGGDPAAYRPRE